MYNLIDFGNALFYVLIFLFMLYESFVIVHPGYIQKLDRIARETHYDYKSLEKSERIKLNLYNFFMEIYTLLLVMGTFTSSGKVFAVYLLAWTFVGIWLRKALGRFGYALDGYVSFLVLYFILLNRYLMHYDLYIFK